ncbi:tetratricopeptide repeat protein [Proteobacteria bacterium 005FR1]|nr:tetratricopeptide repeat protein [Proteobacteria bacterium 005FR1]
MTDIPILADNLSAKVKQLCYQGYQRYDAGDYQQALRAFYQAWLLLPKPQTQWREAGWALTAIGDTYFRTRQYSQSCEALRSALVCPVADQSPFVHLRLGQGLYELGEESEALQHLRLAKKLGGPDVFAREHVKYRMLVDDQPAQASDADSQQPLF